MAWLILFIAGLFETGWAIGLKYSEGFTRIVPTLWTVVALVVSLLMLSWSARELPIGTAYAVWVGIGALGAAVLGIVLFGEPATAGRLFFLTLMLISIAGLKLTSPPSGEMDADRTHPSTAKSPPAVE
jgi:quaternary ammonium compound-resistance protein SugE